MESKEKNTTLLLKNRTALSLTGVSDIISSDENSVYLDTIDGGLIIEGTELHIKSMNIGNGELSLEGRIDSISYHDKVQASKNGFWSRMFR